MFKKSLLALALAGATLTANATTIVNATDSGTVITKTTTTAAAYAISNQGLPLTRGYTLANGATEVLTIDINATEITSLEAGSLLKLTVDGAFFTTHTLTGLVREAVTSTGVSDGTATTADDGSTTINDTPTTHYFKIPAITNAVGITLAINDIPLQIESDASAVTFSAELVSTSGVTVPTTTSPTYTAATVKDQWKLTPTKLNAKIDVSDDRETFTTTTDTSDILGLTTTQQGSGATVDTFKVTVFGDFSGVDTVVGTSGAYTINTAKTEATKTVTEGSANVSDEQITITILTGDDIVAQSEVDFEVSLDVNYTSNGASATFALLDKVAAGSWELNSSSIVMNYVPMGANTQVVVNATSTFAESASVDISYMAVDGTTETITDVATVAPGVVTKLGDAISTAILADMAATSAKTSVTVSVNAPEGSVKFFTGFTNISDGSRMALPQVDDVASNTETQATTAATQATASNTILDTLTATVTDLNTINQTAAANNAYDASLAILAASALATGTNVYVATDLVTGQAICQAKTPAEDFQAADLAIPTAGDTPIAASDLCR